MIPALAAAALALPLAADYRDKANWLCRPGNDAACTADSAASVVTPDGKVLVEVVVRRGNPKADCFYIYPTVSKDATPNSDLVPGNEERGMAASHTGRLASVCRIFAPMYRQVTLAGLHAMMAGKDSGAQPDLAYADVLAAWRDYLANDNGGRPVVLIGHSQGSMLLKKLITEEIDSKPAQALLLSAILPGAALMVPSGKDVGGDFKAIPLCRGLSQTGCAYSWASYRDTAPPPANALFGVSHTDGMTVACTNPARPGGGTASLDAVLGFPWWQGGVGQYRRPPAAAWSVAGVPVNTRYVHQPGLVSGACVMDGGASYLKVHVAPANAAPELTDTMIGLGAIGDTAWPDWGLHVIDLPLVQGDVVRIIAAETAAWKPTR